MQERCVGERELTVPVSRWATILRGAAHQKMINATLYEELRSGDRYERDEVKRPWTAGSKAPKTSWSSSRARAAELLIHASRAQAMPEHRGLQQQQQHGQSAP